MITNTQILTYVQTNRLHYEDSEYLLQEKSETMGVDATSAAKIWIESKYGHADRLDEFEAFELALTNVEEADLATLETLRAKFIANGITANVARVYMHLFEVWVKRIISNIFRGAGMHDEAKTSEIMSEDSLGSVLGFSALPLSANATGTDNEFGESTVVVDTTTEDEITCELGGYV